LLLALCILTILLFSTSSFTNEIFGDISIISLLFVGTHSLTNHLLTPSLT
jgi:hypothetical protein